MKGKGLKAWRQAQIFTQAMLAERLRVETNTVYRWESDHQAIPPYLGLALEQIASNSTAPLKRK